MNTDAAPANSYRLGAALRVSRGTNEARQIMLKLRSIGLSDYLVLEGRQRIGRPASPLPLCGRAAFFVNPHEFEYMTGYRHAVSPSLC